MIGIGPILIVVGVIGIIATYVAIIHWALQSSEISESEVKLTTSRNLDAAPRGNPGQPKQITAFATSKA